MAQYSIIDLKTWARESTFTYFKEFELPFFNLTANIDVSGLKLLCEKEGYSFFLASLFMVMKVANDIPEFKMRIHGDQVIQYKNIRVGSTIQYPDHSFGFSYFPYKETLAEFDFEGKKLVKEALINKSFAPKDGLDDLLHLSVIPWVHFTGMKHARRIGREDSIPKIVLGKFEKTDGKLLMPVNVEVHHALVDGYHTGMFFNKLQEQINNLGSKPDEKDKGEPPSEIPLLI